MMSSIFESLLSTCLKWLESVSRDSVGFQRKHLISIKEKIINWVLRRWFLWMLRTLGQTNQESRLCGGRDWQFDRQRKWNTCTNWILTSARYHTRSPGQTKLPCIHCHLVMRLSSDAGFAKDTRHDDDDSCCGWGCEPLQWGPGQAWQECGADVRDGPHQGDNLQILKVNSQTIQKKLNLYK